MTVEQQIMERTATNAVPAGAGGKIARLPVPELAQPVITRVLYPSPEYRKFYNGYIPETGLADYLFGASGQHIDPDQIFARLRWGGCFVYVSTRHREVEEVARKFPSRGFMIERPPDFVRTGPRWLPLPWVTSKIHYFIARKVQLLLPGQDTERFTYQVSLARHDDPREPFVVLKEVPSPESVAMRLRNRFPEVSHDIIDKRARKFTEKIFPTFLTREAALLMILQEHMAPPYNARVPRVIDVEKDDRGFVRRLRMNWLRNGGEPLPQMEFARQSADLLRVVHDVAGVIHLDLRLDNFVITPAGVGFVDFGSAVRVNENLAENPLLESLFDELMRTSQIQRMLEKMTTSGAVTSSAISRGYQKVDKAVDFFYLAVQFNSPHANPDLAGLILYDPAGRDAKDLSRLTEMILRPPDPSNPPFKSAKDILHGVERIMLKLDQRPRG
ncbi:MAG: hypothetical protein ABSH20_16335 [Tepidisphaeraceae bacterium]|jgi:serine/threonine protein kinase